MNTAVGIKLRLLLGIAKKNTDAYKNAIGKIISGLEITDKALLFSFTDGTKMRLFDDGQQVCERRYMHTDDELDYFVNSVFLGAKIRSGGEECTEDSFKEHQFLIISTDKGEFTVVNYNEHNGYYGGFLILAEDII